MQGNVDASLLVRDETLGKLVELILLLIEVSKLDIEANATGEGEASDDGVVPDEKGVGRQGDKGLAESGREGGHEESKSLNHGSHVLGSLGEGVLE